MIDAGADSFSICHFSFSIFHFPFFIITEGMSQEKN
jgi:hypothetical protein